MIKKDIIINEGTVQLELLRKKKLERYIIKMNGGFLLFCGALTESDNPRRY